MAIDYREQWKLLQHIYGNYTIQDRRGIPSIPTSLNELMNFQIQHTIMEREKLMGEFIKERITTNIDSGTKNSHLVDIVFRNRQLDRVSVSKEQFQNWVESRKGGIKNELL